MININRFVTPYILTVLYLLLTIPSSAEELFYSLKEAGYGMLTGQIQHLSMGRIHGGFDAIGSPLGRDAHSGSLAVTGNYLSPEFQDFTLASHYVYQLRNEIRKRRRARL